MLVLPVVVVSAVVVAVVELMMLLRTLGVLLSIFPLVSCGNSVEKTEVKKYVMALKQGDQAFKPLVKRMIDDYNDQVGYQVVEYSESPDSANSPILITKGLEDRDGKVGWGQWFSQTERRGTAIPVPGQKTSEKTTYSLQVEFDEDFLRSNEKDASPGVLNLEIRKLFAHEVGHGFQMSHAPNERDVMYFDISGEKDFTSYWPQVRGFFGLQ